MAVCNVFGERLRVLRQRGGLTQHDLAEILHLSRATIAGYETRGRVPDVIILWQIADYFHVSVDYLIGRE